MNKFFKSLLKHSTAVSIVSVVLLLLCSAALILNPKIILAILRYGVAALNVVIAVWIIVSLIRTKIYF